MAGARRKARALVLQALYEIDTAGHKVDEVITPLLAGKGCRRKMLPLSES